MRNLLISSYEQYSRFLLFAARIVGMTKIRKDVPNPVPACANPSIFRLSHFEICSYSEEAQRFPGDN